MTETTTPYSVENAAIATELTELEQLNLKVAAIAGWESVEIWNLNVAKKTFTGANKKHPELGNFIPDYTSDLNAIVAVFMQVGLLPELISTKPSLYRKNEVEWAAIHKSPFGAGYTRFTDSNPAIALCKLLIELTKPEPEIQVIDDDGEIG